MNLDELGSRFSVTRAVRSDEYEDRLDLLTNEYILPISDSQSKKLVFAAGQPGSGKSSLVTRIKQDYFPEKFVVIDIDEFRREHPDLDKIKDGRGDIIALTNGFVFDLEEDMIQRAIKAHKNIIYVGTLRDTDFAINFIVRNVRNNGYKVIVNALAVPGVESLLSTQERYESQVNRGAPIPHFVDFDFHQAALIGYEKTLQLFEKNHIVDDIKVFIRGSGEAGLPSRIELELDTIQTIYKSRKILKDKSEYAARLNQLLDLRHQRGASDREIKVLKDIKDYLESL